MQAVGDVQVVIGESDGALYGETVRGLPKLLPPCGWRHHATAVGAERP